MNGIDYTVINTIRYLWDQDYGIMPRLSLSLCDEDGDVIQTWHVTTDIGVDRGETAYFLLDYDENEPDEFYRFKTDIVVE